MFGSAFGAESQAVSLRSAVENGETLRTMAAYIDLNCLRSTPATRTAASPSGGRLEAAAVAAKHSWEERARKTLTTGAEWYRSWLFEEAREQRDEGGNLTRRGLDRKTVEKVKKEGGKLSRP